MTKITLNIEDPKEISLKTVESPINIEPIEVEEVIKIGLVKNGVAVGPTGLSAYQLAVQNGYVGTLEEWIIDLKGDKGDKGDDGTDMNPNTCRFDYITNISIAGNAPFGSIESDNVWTITYIVINSDGTNTITVVHDISWTNRLDYIPN